MASWVLLGAVLAVLLIACANVANLLLARGTTRKREFAIRGALGAGRARLIRQSLTESALLAIGGAALGCALAASLLRVFIAISPQGIPRLRDATLDLRVLFFALAVSIAAGIFFGLASVQHDIPTTANGGATSVSSRRFVRRLLVTAQIAISFVLLAGAGLLLRSLSKLEETPLGMNTSNVIFANISLNPHLYKDPARQLKFFNSLEEQLSGLPGVSASGLSDSLPPSGRAEATAYSAIEVDGSPRTPRGAGGMVTWSSVTPGYFPALAIPIVEGRGFTEEDRAPDVRDIILSESLATQLFPGGDALGKNIRWSPQGAWQTVVGIAGDVKYVQDNGFVQTADPEYYVPRKHALPDAWNYSIVILRTSLNPATIGAWMRSAVASLDPAVPVTINTMGHRVEQLEARPRFNTALLGIFAAIGLLLAAVGTYGVLSFLVTQRTREIGVRTALGAQPRDVANLIVSEAVKLTLAGVAAGIAGAVATTRLMTAMLFGVRTTDAWMFVSVTILLATVALLACWIPARRAMGVDPIVALRHE